MGQRALITGISGFVGGFLAEHLLDCGDEVFGLAPDGRLTEASPEGLADRVELAVWDLGRDASPSAEVMDRLEAFGPEVIYHLAALSIPDDCGRIEPTEAAWAVNVEGTRRVVELAARFDGSPKVLLVSSSHVYAPVSFESPEVDESLPVGPSRGYGKTKLAAERVALESAEKAGVPLVIARAFQHTGPRQSPRMMLPQWARQLVELETGKFGMDRPIEIYTRDARIDLTDVRDVVRAYRLLLEKGRPGEIYNVGSGYASRTGDLFDRLVGMADVDRPVIELHPGPKQDPIAVIDRLRRVTGWTPEISLEKTLAETLAYWRDR